MGTVISMREFKERRYDNLVRLRAAAIAYVTRNGEMSLIPVLEIMGVRYVKDIPARDADKFISLLNGGRKNAG